MHNRIKVVLACLVLVAASGLAETAAAAVRHPKLDAVASEFAGRPIAADCYTDSADDFYNWDVTYKLWGVYGVYYPSQPNDVFLSPAACQPLLTELGSGMRDAGRRPFSLALSVLLHESFHARGWVNEADTEACAMRFLPDGLADFGIYPTKTIAVKQVRTRWARRKVGKRTIRYRTSRVVTVYRDVVDRDYGQILGWARYFHNLAPPEYLNGTCQ
jgi:hypothetical protein